MKLEAFSVSINIPSNNTDENAKKVSEFIEKAFDLFTPDNKQCINFVYQELKNTGNERDKGILTRDRVRSF